MQQRPGALKGAAIRLFEPSKLLALTEGIETALAVHMLTDWPVWACISANGMSKVIVPNEVETVFIGADNDEAGLNAARNLSKRLIIQNKQVRLATPPDLGDDWLDTAMKEEDRDE